MYYEYNKLLSDGLFIVAANIVTHWS